MEADVNCYLELLSERLLAANSQDSMQVGMTDEIYKLEGGSVRATFFLRQHLTV